MTYMNDSIIAAFGILTLAVSILYFVIFSRTRERFMQYWGLSWVAYALSLFSLLLYLMTERELFLEIRKIVDMFNLLLLLFGSYSFLHRRIPTYWYRFSLYLLLLAAICILYRIELLSFYLPICVYQLILTLFLCCNVFFRWNGPKGQRLAAALTFLLWGAGKSVFSIVDIFTVPSGVYLLAEMMMSIVVNYCIFAIYISHARSEASLTDTMYRTVVEHSREAMFCYQLRPEPLFSYVSPSIREMTGYSPENFYMDPRLMFTMTAEPFAGDITDLFEGRLKRNDYPALELYRKDGSKFWCEFGCTFVSGEDGEPAALVGSMRDVTNLKTAEVEQVNETRRRNILLSYISHELRTPITSIAGFLTAIQDGTLRSEEEKQEAMEIITSRTLTLKKLIDDLDQLAKFESNQFTFDFEACCVRDLAEDLLSRSAADIEQQGFLVHVDADMQRLESFWVIVDLDRINQVFSNLLTNAVKYSGSSRNIWIRFDIDQRKENFLVFVRDEGIGIRDTQISHVFDRFYRVDYNNSAEYGGRGLGLTLSKEIIEAHQGEIYAESVYGEGSTFSFTIPLYQED